VAEVTSDITRNLWKLRAVVSDRCFEVALGFHFIIVYYRTSAECLVCVCVGVRSPYYVMCVM